MTRRALDYEPLTPPLWKRVFRRRVSFWKRLWKLLRVGGEKEEVRPNKQRCGEVHARRSAAFLKAAFRIVVVDNLGHLLSFLDAAEAMVFWASIFPRLAVGGGGVALSIARSVELSL